MNKRGFIHHPIFLGFLIGLILGIALTYLIANGTIPIPLKIC